jgi:hypothetical protein
VALHYASIEDGPLAARVLEVVGFALTQRLPLPDGSSFYRFSLNHKDLNRGDNIVYLSLLPEAQRELMGVIREKLKVGAPDEHPAVANMRAAQAKDPEYTFHVGVLVDSLEALERTMLKLVDSAQTDPQLKGRMKIVLNRARRGTPEVDRRLDESPLYGKVERYAYGRNGVQAFLETDLLVGGPLGDRLVIELDYVFPGYKDHILSTVEL